MLEAASASQKIAIGMARMRTMRGKRCGAPVVVTISYVDNTKAQSL